MRQITIAVIMNIRKKPTYKKIDESRIDKRTLWEVAYEKVHQNGGRERLKFVTMEMGGKVT